ncbi:hypothetical protein RJT34_20093 [Clitoria ternatea]|uniref:Uncharacterized protein n=1 Tax=Clitoria ternatea TaxID=43366 RepID=A0AAN9IS86_CLITE
MKVNPASHRSNSKPLGIIKKPKPKPSISLKNQIRPIKRILRKYFPKNEKYVPLSTGGETGSEDDGLLDLSDDDFFLVGSSNDGANVDDE